MKRFAPLMAIAVIVAIAAIAVLGFDITPLHAANEHLGLMVAEGGASIAAAEQLAREFKAHHDEIKDLLAKGAEKDSELASRLQEIEQKMARRGGGGATVSETWGSQVERQLQTKSIPQGYKGRLRYDVKAVITSATTDADGSAGALVQADRQGTILELARRKLRIRQLFAPGRTTSNTILWPRQTGRTIGAATVAENALKPSSDFKFDEAAWPVRTIAHWVYASRQILDDAPLLSSLIDTDLRYGVNLVEENQLLNGSGTGADLTGVYTNAEEYAGVLETASDHEIDILLQAIAQVDDTEFDADGIVVNPLDWRRMQGLKDTAGKYLGSGPFGELVQRLWQIPIVTSKAMPSRKFMVGAFQAGAQIFDREDATVEISNEDGDNFRYNRVTVLAEKRLAFVVKRPDVFVKGDFDEAVGV